LLVRRVELQALAHREQRRRAEQRGVVEVQDIEVSPQQLLELAPRAQRVTA
jgi:hypothetical protein